MQNLIMIFFWILLGLACSHFANKRGRNPYTWFFIGMFLGVFGLLLLFVLPIKKDDVEVIVEPIPPPPPEEKEPIIQRFWYYLDNENKQFGPMSFEALKTASTEGKVTPNTYVWNEDLENWKLYGELT